MTSNPLGLKLAAIEIVQRENPGSLLEPFDKGTLAACRRSGDPELVARVAAVERIEASRDTKRAKVKPKPAAKEETAAERRRREQRWIETGEM